MTQQQIIEAGFDQLLDSYLKAMHQQEELDAAISVIKDEMILRLDAEHVKGKVVADYSISKVTRLNFKPSLEQARELAATKTVESIDTQALKRLHDSGVQIPNTTTTTFVMVRRIEPSEAK